jgi:hypothetical protein
MCNFTYLGLNSPLNLPLNYALFLCGGLFIFYSFDFKLRIYVNQIFTTLLVD